MGKPLGEWTADRVAELTMLHGARLSCAKIAKTMGGTTRNAVIGKLFRLGLKAIKPESEGPKPVRGPPRVKTERTRIVSANSNSNAMRVLKTVVFSPFQPRCVEIVPRHVSLIDLEPEHCRYPYGDETLTFCGHARQDASSYCPQHHDLCWVKPISQNAKYLIKRAAA